MSLRAAATNLSQDNEYRLHLYSIAAVAAGVSLLVLTPSSEAKVLITRKTIAIHSGHPFSLDINHDGITDLQLILVSEPGACTSFGSLYARMAAGAAAIGTSSGPYGSAIVQGAK